MVTGKRMKAEDRKKLILEAAISEYGRVGMHATSVEAIADRAGVSQPYIFRLFGTKTDLIVAAIEHHTTNLRHAFREAVEHKPNDMSALEAMGLVYLQQLSEDANAMRCQLHTWAAASDPAIKAVAQRTYTEIWHEIAELSGADAHAVREFMALGKLLTVLGALELTHLFGDPQAALKEF
jgi:AcrR family transcriptional regulator